MITFIEVEIFSSVDTIQVYREVKSPLKNGMTEVKIMPIGAKA